MKLDQAVALSPRVEPSGKSEFKIGLDLSMTVRLTYWSQVKVALAKVLFSIGGLLLRNLNVRVL